MVLNLFSRRRPKRLAFDPAYISLRDDPRNLRMWLHRIDEACARKDAPPEIVAIRDAALAALRGEPAPTAPASLATGRAS